MGHQPVSYTIALLMLTALWIAPARASLGSDAASVVADADDLHGMVLPQTRGQFQIQQIVSDNGMQVREFLSSTGVVFAVTWQGPVMPNLRQLLGAQFPLYAAALAAQQRPGLHRAVRVATPELVVESDGHLRAYVGRSYLPAMIPAGVSIRDLL
jgi:hypothetical protein